MNKEMTVNGKSYTIIKLLGKGKGGYSYLAESGNNRYVLKQIHLLIFWFNITIEIWFLQRLNV